MKAFRMIGMAFVAMMLSFSVSSCSDDDDNFIPVDYSKDLVGTWTCLEPGYACALVINADGTAVATSVIGDEFREDVRGIVKVENNKISWNFEDGINFDGRFEMIPGETLSTVDTKTGNRVIYRYCKQDLSKEIIGQWVKSTGNDEEMIILNYHENGESTYTGLGTFGDYKLNVTSTYKVIGDLLIQHIIEEKEGSDVPMYMVANLIYTPDGTAYGDIMTKVSKIKNGDEEGEYVQSFLRIKQNLELPTAKYNYKSTYISNAKGEGVINIDGYNFDFSKMDGVTVDKLFKTLLYTLEFPTTDSLTYSYTLNGTTFTSTVPVVVEGNKMTVHMDKSEGHYRDMNLYVFQDKDNTQMHIYMSKSAFINFFGNTALSFAAKNGQIDPTNVDAVNVLFNQIELHVTSINASFVLTKSK